MGQKYAANLTVSSSPCGWHCTKSLPHLGSVSLPLPSASPVVIHLCVAGLWVWVLVIDIKTCPWVLEDKLDTW